jgi:hypothetical protein
MEDAAVKLLSFLPSLSMASAPKKKEMKKKKIM